MQALLLDHNQVDCAKLIDQLGYGGYETVAVASVKEARAALDRQRFDLLIFELKLPDGHGFELCSELRERSGDDMIIVFVSYDAAPQRRVTGIQLGADDFISKPCDTDELLTRITIRTRHRIPTNSGAACGC